MPARVNKIDRIIVAVGISIECLRIGRRFDDGVRGDESSNERIVVSGSIVVQACLIVQFLSGKIIPRYFLAGTVAVSSEYLAEGFVFRN